MRDRQKATSKGGFRCFPLHGLRKLIGCMDPLFRLFFPAPHLPALHEYRHRACDHVAERFESISNMNRIDSIPNIAPSRSRRLRIIHRAWMVRAVVAWIAIVCVGVSAECLGQPPATYPPPELLRPSATPPESGKIPIKGFLFLDASNVPVLMPGMTYERVQELESGSNNQARRYVFDGVNIDGRVNGNRAELTVELRIQVDATGGETIKIPLAMGNFHRLGSVEFFSGSQNGNKLAVSVDPDSGKHELIVSVEEDTVVGFRMQMSARVEIKSVNSLDFRLPPSPVVINLTSDSRDVIGQIPNRNDEVIMTTTDPAGRSRFMVESSGGSFILQWGKMDRPLTVPLLETTSDITMQWNSPQDPMIQNVRMTVRDSRGPISSFRLRLPSNATLRDDPKLITSGQFGQLVEITQTGSATQRLFAVTIPKQEQQQSIVLEFRVEIPSASPTAENALDFEVPVVEDALRNQGRINITTGADYRLRWQQRSYVKNVSSAIADKSTVDGRVYSFQYIRGAFKLPLWLDATKRELRVTSECEIEVRDNYANLTMEIRSIGNGNQAQLLSVDLADWLSPRIENARTGAALTWYESDDLIEIEMDYTGMEESIPIMIKASRVIGDGSSEGQAFEGQDQRVDLPIPRVVGTGDRRDPVMIQEALVQLTGKSRRSLVVDLERSENLERLATDDAESDDATRRFAVMPPESAGRIIGVMVPQPPRLIMENAQSTIKLIGGQLEVIVNWKIETLVDLEGRLRIAIPEDTRVDNASSHAASVIDASLADASASDASLAMDAPVSGNRDDSIWTAWVNDTRVQLREITDPTNDPTNEPITDPPLASPATMQYELISDSLTTGKMDLRFRSLLPVDFDEEFSEAAVEIGLPYPLVQDITLQGNVEVDLSGDESHDLTSSEVSLSEHLVFRTLPTKTIPLRITPRAPAQSELLTGKIVVRSAINEISQHDQLIASLVGNGDFMLQLHYPQQTDIQVALNGIPAAFKVIDEQLVVRIPPDADRHLVDVRLWVDRTAGEFFQTIEPLAHVGPGSGQLFWQLTVPTDSHLVWTTPSVGRAMQWGFDGWRLIRRPLLTETALASRIGSIELGAIELSPMPAGNSYLFSSMDDRSFRVMTCSRTVLWMIVAGVIVFVTALLTYIPATRNPLSFVIAIVCFGGLLAVTPDAAILVGQVAMLAMVLAVVMLAIRSLVLPHPSRVLSSTRDRRIETSSKSARQPVEYRPPSSIAVTHSIGPEDISSSPDEVAS